MHHTHKHTHTPAGSKTSSMTGGRRNPQSMVVVATGLRKWGGLDVQAHTSQWSRHSDNGQKTGGTITHSPARNVRLHTHCAATVDTSWNTHTHRSIQYPSKQLQKSPSKLLTDDLLLFLNNCAAFSLSPLLCFLLSPPYKTKLETLHSIKGISATWWVEHTKHCSAYL